MSKLRHYSSSPTVRRYITRYNHEAFAFAVKYAGNITVRDTPVGKVFEIWI